MRLTIDTSTDTKDDLRRVIRFLQLFVNEHRPELRAFEEEPAPISPTALGDFFTNLDKPADKPKEPSNDFKLDFF